jgi:nucleoside-diphosphate-sugar epimerase
MLEMIILPRQARDRHRENLKRAAFFAGQYNYPQRWGITDVRDCADGYRRIAESHTVQTGDRFFTITTEEAGGYPTPYELVDMLKQIYPEEEGIGGDMLDQRGNFIPPEMDDWLLVGSTKAQDELALRCHTGTDTLRDTIESLRKFGCLDEIHAQMVVAAQLQEAPKL